MRAPLLVPSLLLLDAIVAARDPSSGVVTAIWATAFCALVAGRTAAHMLAAGAVAAGLLLGAWHGPPAQAEGASAGVTITGTIVSDVTPRAWGNAFELVDAAGRRYAVSLPDAAESGERLTVRGDVEPFDAPRNPGEPSARDFAAEQGLYARLVRARVLARAPEAGFDLRTLAARVRSWANAALHRELAEPDATILAGMLYGARGTLPPDLREEFQDTGTVHVLVTAGLHLGVVAALAVFLLSRLGLGRTLASVSAIPLIWTYALVSGGHIPSLRAAVMATVALVARAAGERAISLNTLAFAAIVVAALWPAWVGGASFGLSFSCVAAIALFAEPIERALHRTHLPGALREALALTLSTQLGVWPLTAATFLVIAPYAALANLFVVPVVGIALTGGLLLLAATPFPPLAAAVAHLEAWPLAWIESAVHLSAHLPFAHVVATPPPPWTLAAYDGAMAAAAALLRADGRRPAQLQLHYDPGVVQ